MALKVTRSNGVSFSARFSLSASTTCQEIASPSRSGSVARISFSAPFEGLGDVGDALAALRVDLPEHPEIVVRVDRAVLCRQIADVPEGGQDLVVAAEIFVDRLRLRGRFDDEDLHESASPEAGRNDRDGRGRRRASWGRRGALKWVNGDRKSNSGLPGTRPGPSGTARPRRCADRTEGFEGFSSRSEHDRNGAGSRDHDGCRYPAGRACASLGARRRGARVMGWMAPLRQFALPSEKINDIGRAR